MTTFNGFKASFYTLNKREPTAQEIFDAGVRFGLQRMRDHAAAQVEDIASAWSNLPPEYSRAIANFFARNIRGTELVTDSDPIPAEQSSRWPMLAKFHLESLMFAYNEGYSKAYDGREFPNPFSEIGSQAAAWELGTRDGK